MSTSAVSQLPSGSIFRAAALGIRRSGGGGSGGGSSLRHRCSQPQAVLPLVPSVSSSLSVRRRRTQQVVGAMGKVVEGDVEVGVHIVGQNMEIIQGIQDHVEERVSKAICNFETLLKPTHAVEVKCTLRSKGSKTYKVEMTLTTKSGVVRSEEETGNLFSSIDKASTKAQRKLRKLKEKSQHLIHGQKRIRASDIVTEEPVGSLISEEVSEPSIPETLKRVVRSKYFTVEPMTVEEAMDNIQLVGHKFYVFLNKESGDVNVLYERNHGGYGVIIPLIGSGREKASSGDNGTYASELERYEETA